MAEDYRVDVKEPGRELVGAPTSVGAVPFVNYHRMKVVGEEEDKQNNRRSQLLQAGDTYIGRRKTFSSQRLEPRVALGEISDYKSVGTVLLCVDLQSRKL